MEPDLSTPQSPIAIIMRKPGVIPGVVGIAALGVGFAVGYILGKKRAKTVVIGKSVVGEIQQLVRDGDHIGASIRLADQHPSNPDIRVVEQASQPGILDHVREQSDRIAYDRVMKDEEVRAAVYDAARESEKINADEVEEKPSLINVFHAAKAPIPWNWEVEKANRNPLFPYVLHKDEFMNDEMDFQQSTITFYKQDNVVADTLDTPLYNWPALLGELKFGHGTDDPNVVYIRNEGISMEYEVLLHQGSFEQEVNGLTFERETEAQELRHSSGPPRMRWG